MKKEKFVISGKSLIRDAFRKIQINKEGFILLENSKKEVYALATDGDIRTGLLSGITLDNKIDIGIARTTIIIVAIPQLPRQPKNPVKKTKVKGNTASDIDNPKEAIPTVLPLFFENHLPTKTIAK